MTSRRAWTCVYFIDFVRYIFIFIIMYPMLINRWYEWDEWKLSFCCFFLPKINRNIRIHAIEETLINSNRRDITVDLASDRRAHFGRRPLSFFDFNKTSFLFLLFAGKAGITRLGTWDANIGAAVIIGDAMKLAHVDWGAAFYSALYFDVYVRVVLVDLLGYCWGHRNVLADRLKLFQLRVVDD